MFFQTPEMEREKLSANNGQQSNSRDRKRKSDEQQEKLCKDFVIFFSSSFEVNGS
jgi:hypothetical protein